MAKKRDPKELLSGKTAKELLSRLIAAETVNPPGEEFKATEKIIPFLKKNKIKFKEFEKEKGRTNLIAYLGKWNTKPEVMVVTHLDTVPAGEGWKTNAFTAVEKKGKIYGRGAEDNKGAVVAALLAIKELKKKEKELKRNEREELKEKGKKLKEKENKLQGKFSIAMLADEEHGSVLGMQYLLVKKLINPDYAIVLDNGKPMNEINIGEKGVLHLKVSAHGKQAHGAVPEKGVNAIIAISEFLQKLKKFKMKYKKMRLFSAPTINVGTISGGTAINMVPAYCEVKLDVRYLPNQNTKEIIQGIKKIANRLKKKTKAKIKIEKIVQDPAWKIEKENLLIEKLKEKTKQVRGKTPKIAGLSGATDARKLIRKNCLAVGFGIGNEMAHQANEYIELKQVTQLAEVIELVAEELLK